MMLNLPGYQQTNQIYAGKRTLVYRATQESDRRRVVVKVLRNPFPHFNDLLYFRNQYLITRHLEHPSIVRPLALERYGNGYALIMPDEGALALSKYWPNSDQKLMDFFTMAIQLAEALHYLSLQRIIHKDIKPSNILIHPKTLQVQLLDFSISSLLPKEQQQLLNPNVLEGTLAYMSPEQTGRMNRDIDYRTDFYSLGVTFFQLLTGKLPFTTKDPIELVHCHLVEKVKFPVDSWHRIVPEALQGIVLKLMAKNGEDRYQNALGLKHDLEECLHQWEQTKKIIPFKLGERDVCDRFLISEQLYGREKEVQTLLNAFERAADGNREMMVVAGFSGIGKTSVVNEVHKPIVKERGYFIKGKFDQFHRNIPLFAFVQAFRDLIRQLLGESDAELVIWKTKILEAVGESGQVIIDVIPELERIIGKQPPVPQILGTAAQNRFNLLFGKFVRVFTTKKHPLIIFLDDLQWVDLASLNLLKLLMNESEVGCLLVLGAYRDNEVFSGHLLMLTLADLHKQGANVNTLTLLPLNEGDISRLVADTLVCSEELAAPLSELVYQKTRGNPFFATQFLQGLHEDGYIVFAHDMGYWECDLTQVRQLALTDDVVEFMVGRLRKLPEATQAVLMLAACMGNQFDLATLAVICEKTQEETATELWRALQEGFLIPESEIYKFFQDFNETNFKGDEYQQHEIEIEEVPISYRFLHDRVQQAAYTLIPNAKKQTTHVKIGQLLLNNTPASQQEEKIFAIVNQLNYGADLLATRTEREQLSQLNLKAGRKVLASTAYKPAIEYLQIGLELLELNAWQEQYRLCLALHESAAEATYLGGDLNEMERLIEIVLQQAKSILDQIKVYEIKIQAYAAQNQFRDALQVALQGLHSLEVYFPNSPMQPDVEAAFADVTTQLQTKTIAELVDLPLMQDPNTRAILQLLVRASASSFQSAPNLFPLIFLKIVDISLKYGNAAESALGYGLYGVLITMLLEDWDRGYQFGEVALKLLEKFDNKHIECQTKFIVNCSLKFFNAHLKNVIQPILEAYQIGLESGEIEFAGLNILHHCDHCFFTGYSLPDLDEKMSVHILVLEQFEETTSSNILRMYRQAVVDLIYGTVEAGDLVGNVYDELQDLPRLQAAQNGKGLFYLYLIKLLLCCFFQDFVKAMATIEVLEQYVEISRGSIPFPIFLFFDSLTHLMMYSKVDETKQKQFLDRVVNNQKHINQWATRAPMNYRHKWHLVEAERHRILGHPLEAIEAYDLAIAEAKANDYIQEEAMANEFTAKFYLEWGKEKIATSYMQEAYYAYARWGAKAKTDDLEQQYPHLLEPILQQAKLTMEPFETLVEVVGSNQSLPNSSKNTSYSSSSTNTFIDFAAIIKASQSLSGIIELDELIHQLTKIILQNSGGDRCALIIPDPEGHWQVEAITTLNTSELSTQPLEDNPKLPVKLIHYVKNTQEMVMIENLKTDLPVMDEYLSQQRPQSLLCLPLLNQRQLVGILYLQNQLTSGVFTSDRLLIIKFLCTQAAISLEKARLYKQSQAYAQQLEVSLSKLQASETSFRHLAANIPGTIYQLLIATDGSATVPYASSGCQEIYEVSAEEMMAGKYTFRDFEHPQDRQLVDRGLADLGQTLEQFNVEFRIVTPSGIVKWIQVVSHPLKKEDGSILWEGVIMDVSHRKQIEAERENLLFELAKVNQELEQVNQELANYSQTLEQKVEQRTAELKTAQERIIAQEKLASLGTLTAGVAHELRNPLNFVKNYAEGSVELSQELLDILEPIISTLDPETLELTQSIIDDLQENATTICHHSIRATEIIETMMQHTHVEYKQSIPQATHLHDLLDQAVKLVSQSKKDQDKPFNPSIRTNYAANLDLIKVISNSLIRALINLMDNAFDAMRSKQNQFRANSPIGIMDYTPTLWVSTQILLEEVEIRIRDNGCGIEPGIKSKILDPFFTTKPPGEGTGLGLSLTYDIIVKQHQGSINIDSKPGEFTEIILRLPNLGK
ncbi:trifunctional serine/threonine-protein kinase/ATP-binding protein/sensor histidine kinase [Dapis sp. BLCC M126]|uniref:trifunctional serine/threonine-protein kinase/ATP-binding protein/sensor histidine kinase n=1 Tax=Dapis sp. BLCC M126 TaxID=3400189 RepID=UPI003CF037DE